jgi:hypothetical protein
MKYFETEYARVKQLEARDWSQFTFLITLQLARKEMVVHEHERLSNFTFRHKLK